ncbi:MAG: hypothetical protein HY390_01760 [Deltaproteobacteria bacterium]|nr:hypothetical protein [Deltaproteobacteria bacterium]
MKKTWRWINLIIVLILHWMQPLQAQEVRVTQTNIGGETFDVIIGTSTHFDLLYTTNEKTIKNMDAHKENSLFLLKTFEEIRHLYFDTWNFPLSDAQKNIKWNIFASPDPTTFGTRAEFRAVRIDSLLDSYTFFVSIDEFSLPATSPDLRDMAYALLKPVFWDLKRELYSNEHLAFFISKAVADEYLNTLGLEPFYLYEGREFLLEYNKHGHGDLFYVNQTYSNVFMNYLIQTKPSLIDGMQLMKELIQKGNEEKKHGMDVLSEVLGRENLNHVMEQFSIAIVGGGNVIPAQFAFPDSRYSGTAGFHELLPGPLQNLPDPKEELFKTHFLKEFKEILFENGFKDELIPNGYEPDFSLRGEDVVEFKDFSYETPLSPLGFSFRAASNFFWKHDTHHGFFPKPHPLYFVIQHASPAIHVRGLFRQKDKTIQVLEPTEKPFQENGITYDVIRIPNYVDELKNIEQLGPDLIFVAYNADGTFQLPYEEMTLDRNKEKFGYFLFTSELPYIKKVTVVDLEIDKPLSTTTVYDAELKQENFETRKLLVDKTKFLELDFSQGPSLLKRIQVTLVASHRLDTVELNRPFSSDKFTVAMKTNRETLQRVDSISLDHISEEGFIYRFTADIRFHQNNVPLDLFLMMTGHDFRDVVIDGDPQTIARLEGNLWIDDDAAPDQLHKISVKTKESQVSIKTSRIGSHTCAILKDSSLKCWGKNDVGQLGDGTIDNKSAAGPVLLENGSPLGTIHEVALGRNHTCALLRDGSVYCWGLNTSGQVGNGTTSNQSFASQVKDESGNAILHVKEIVAGLSHSCARLENGSVACWGGGEPFATQVKEATPKCYDTNAITNAKVFAIQRYCKVSGAGAVKEEFEILLESVQKIEAGYSHTCALLNNGNVKCWGANTDGQLGTGGDQDNKVAVPVMDKNGEFLSNVKEMALSQEHSCALLNDETVSCWGRRPAGETPFGSTQDFTAFPILLGPTTHLTNVKSIGLGQEHSCALLNNGTVKCWGKNVSSQLGDNTALDQMFAVSVKNLSDVKEIEIGKGSSETNKGAHSCAILNDGKAKCWGYNFYLQCGSGANRADLSKARFVQEQSGNQLENVKQISCSSEHTCGILNDGSIYCWGKNSSGQVGDTTFESPRTKAVNIQVGD